MVQFLSIIFFSWISSIFVGFFKSSLFLCHPVHRNFELFVCTAVCSCCDCTEALAVGTTEREWSVVRSLLFVLRVVVIYIAVSIVYGTRRQQLKRWTKPINVKTVHFVG